MSDLATNHLKKEITRLAYTVFPEEVQGRGLKAVFQLAWPIWALRDDYDVDTIEKGINHCIRKIERGYQIRHPAQYVKACCEYIAGEREGYSEDEEVNGLEAVYRSVAE